MRYGYHNLSLSPGYFIILSPNPTFRLGRGSGEGRNHVGSRFLTGEDRIEAATVSDEDAENLSAYIHGAAGSSTLAGAKVILPQTQVTQSIPL